MPLVEVAVPGVITGGAGYCENQYDTWANGVTKLTQGVPVGYKTRNGLEYVGFGSEVAFSVPDLNFLPASAFFWQFRVSGSVDITLLYRSSDAAYGYGSASPTVFPLMPSPYEFTSGSSISGANVGGTPWHYDFNNWNLFPPQIDLGFSVESLRPYFGASLISDALLLMTPPFQNPPGLSGSGEHLISRTRVAGIFTSVDLVIFYDDAAIPSDATTGEHLCAAAFNNVIVTAWTTNPNGGHKQVKIGIQRGLRRNTGSGSGSSSGWTTYVWGDVHQDANIGLHFLPNGVLSLTYDYIDSGGTRTSRTSINRAMGEQGQWTNGGDATPNRAQGLSTGRALMQTHRARVGS